MEVTYYLYRDGTAVISGKILFDIFDHLEMKRAAFEAVTIELATRGECEFKHKGSKWKITEYKQEEIQLHLL